MWLKILLILIAILFIAVLIIKRFAYFRPSFEFIAPRDAFQDIYEGNLHAWLKESPHNTQGYAILFCHGNGGNLSHRQDKIINLSKIGVSVLIFDYSGYGQSRGVPNENMCYSNADMFYNFLLRRGYAKNNIIPYGESMGSAVAAYIARKYNLPKVIIESGLPSMREMAKICIPKLTFLSILFPEFDTVNYLTGYKGNILAMHCLNDEIVPYSIIQSIKQLASTQGEFIDMEGSHNNVTIPWQRVQNFIFKHI